MKLDRLIGILVTLLRSERITAPVLAERFEVSRRTIRRDIDLLCQAGIPIITRQGSNGGISIEKSYRLEKSVLTTEELTSIVTALKGLGSVAEAAQIKEMLHKLSGDAPLKENIRIDLGAHHKNSLPEKIRLFSQAIRENRRIVFDYYYEKGEVHREIEPYCMRFEWMDWYIFGFCLTRQDWRLFKFSRLWEPALVEKRFAPRAIPPEKLKSDEWLTDTHRLAALFDPCVKYRLIESYGPRSFTETEDGRLYLETNYTNSEFVLNWLLGLGGHVQVLEPGDLAAELLAAAKNIVARYE